MKVITQDTYMQICPCSNGWLIRYYEWNKSEFRWEEILSAVYQDFEVLMETLKDSLTA